MDHEELICCLHFHFLEVTISYIIPLLLVLHQKTCALDGHVAILDGLGSRLVLWKWEMGLTTRLGKMVLIFREAEPGPHSTMELSITVFAGRTFPPCTPTPGFLGSTKH